MKNQWILWLLVAWLGCAQGQVKYPYFPPPGMTYSQSGTGGVTSVMTAPILNVIGQNNNGCLGGLGYTCGTAVPSLKPTGTGKELILCAGIPGSGTGLAGNNCGLTEILGSQGDYEIASTYINPVIHYASTIDSASASGLTFSIETSAGIGLQFGSSEISSTACPTGIQGAPYVPAVGQPFCSFIHSVNANPLVFGMAAGVNVALAAWGGDANSLFMALGGTTPTKWLQVSSTGTNQASTTLGDSAHSTSVTNLVGGSRANTQAGGVPIVTQTVTAPTISSGFGTSPSISQNNGPQSFSINVGTGGTASSGVVGLPAAAHAWACSPSDTGATPTGQTEATGPSTTTTVTITNYSRTTGTALAWTAGEIIQLSCWAN